MGQVPQLKRKPVDMILLREREKEVLAAMRVFASMGQAGFSKDFLSKAVLMASFRFFEMNAIEEGLKVLAALTPEYVKDVLPGQMEEDSTLREVAVRIANSIVDADLVRPQYVLEEATLVPNRADA